MKNTTVTNPNAQALALEKQKQFENDLQNIAYAWPRLPEHVRRAICTLVANCYPDEKDSL